MKQTAHIHCGDALELLARLPDCSIDAVVQDPPSGISFMGKSWDSDKGGRDAWISWLAEIMREVWRVTKPGGHALVWALPRTQHWTATAVENAGWEVRDVLMHVFGSGFPKSTSVSLRIDAEAGATNIGKASDGKRGYAPGTARVDGIDRTVNVTAPPNDEAKQWAGWGTALKPSHEAWILARKPLAGTVAANVLEHGTGALNIDGCRVGAYGGTKDTPTGQGNKQNEVYGTFGACKTQQINAGRWPPHLLLSHGPDCGETCADGCPVAQMDAQSGISPAKPQREGRQGGGRGVVQFGTGGDALGVWPADSGGGASRFFPVFRYVAKPSTAEKSAGLGKQNTHATVKSVDLMRWLCRLITPPGGTVLDVFAGSGTTGVAAMHEGFSFIGCEMRPEHAEAARKRIEHAMAGLEVEQTGEKPAAKPEDSGQQSLW